ncbi:MAG: hypothetical protein U1A73_27270 [Pseudomonas sp.]|nr:hypothetical protein [Pseudomonas sp.]
MADFFVKSGSGVLALSNRAWTLGERMVPIRSDATTNHAIAKRWVWEVTTAGTSNGTPTWPASATQDVTTVTQNGVVWTARKPGYSSGSTMDWTFATIYMKYATLAMAAGDWCKISNNHAESHTTDEVITFPGTVANPCYFACMSDAASPPTTPTTGATVTTTGGTFITIGGTLYGYGVYFSAGSGSVNSGIMSCGAPTGVPLSQVFERCTFKQGSTTTSTQRIAAGNSADAYPRLLYWKNCDVVFSGAGNQISTQFCNFVWDGGVMTGSTAPNIGVFNANSNSILISNLEIRNVDMSGMPAATPIFQWNQLNGDHLIANCRLPASWSGALVNGAFTGPCSKYRMMNCDSADTQNREWIENFAGTSKTETVIVATDGDGTSLKLASTAGCNIVARLESGDIYVENLTTGSPITVTVPFCHDSVTALTNAEAFLELVGLITSGYPLGTVHTDSAVAFMNAANQPASATTFTTTGMTNPQVQDLAITFTPQEAGILKLRVVLTKASKTGYACTKARVS